MSATAILLTGGASASADPLSIQQTFVGPITGSSQCTTEPKLPENNNDGVYDPTLPTYWSTADNLGGFEDMVQRPEAGTFSDLCVGFRLDPYRLGTRAGSQGGPFAGPSNPATNVATGDDLERVSITLPAGYGARFADAPVCSEADFGLTPEAYIAMLPSRPGSTTLVPKRTASDPGNGYDVQPIWDTPANCPESGLIGEASARAANPFNLLPQVMIGGGMYTGEYDDTLPEWIGGAIWQLPPGQNDLARLGVQLYLSGLTLPIKFTVSLRLAPDGSGRVISTVNHIPRVAMVLPLSPTNGQNLYMESVAITLWGRASEHPARTGENLDGLPVRWPAAAQNVAETPTRCDATATGSVVGQTYGGVFSALPETYTPTPLSATIDGVQMTGCDQVPFAPAVDVDVAERRPGVPTAATVKVRVDQTAVGGRLPSHLKDAAVTLPAGLTLGGQVATDADGLQLCSAADFAVSDVTVAAACAAETEAATAAITSPLISRQFTGKVFLGEPASGAVLPQLFLEATLAGSSGADAPRFKLVGTVVGDADGRLTATFSDAPQLRWSELELSFPGGDHALFATAPRCGSTAGSARMTPWSSQSAVEVATSQVLIDEDCDAGFAPKVTVEPLDPRAGKKGAVRVTVERESNEPWLDNLNVHLPAGFLADLNSAKECPAADAALGNCGSDSKIGTIEVLAGAGPQPLALDGEMYLAERKGTDVAGAVIVTQAKVGDLDLGTVVVPGRILLRPTDAGLDFITDVPLYVEGVALQLQKVVVNLDRPNFALNPSACGPLAYDAEITGDAGEAARPAGTVTYTGCKELGFTPKLQAILTGDNTPGGHPGMYVVLTSPEGDAGMKSAAVTLPDGVVADLANTKNTCTVAQFNASACPATAKIGTAKAEVSIVPDQLVGNIFMVAIPGKSLPGLGLDFGGRYAQRVLSTVSTDRDSRLVTTFAAIPDLPLRRLVIDVASSPKSPLQISETSPCDANSGWQGVFTAQGGQSSTSKTGLQCAAQPKTTLSAKAGLSFRLFDFGTRNLSYLKIALPKGWSINAKAAKKPDAIWVRTTGGSATIKLAKRSLFVNATGKTTDVRLKISAAVLKGPRKLKKGSTVTLPVRLAFTDGTIQQQTISLTLK